MIRRTYRSHKRIMEELGKKYEIAEMIREEHNLKMQIFKMRFPFHLTIKFNKLIVFISIAAIILYTTAAIFLQKYTMTELSPTLTTCVYAFFGTELIGLAGIKICDTKFNSNDDITNDGDNDY